MCVCARSFSSWQGDGQQCRNYVDRRLTDMCQCHKDAAYAALKTGRMELNNAASVRRQHDPLSDTQLTAGLTP